MSESSFCLENGLTIATDHMGGIETVAVSVLVKAGSRNEKKEVNGISHFLEHMAFKGTKTRSAKQIAEEFDDIGGYFNAYTSREKTVYYAKVLKDDLNVAIDILADILQNSLFAEEEIERERGVILQEIAQTEDMPDDLIFDHFQETAFSGQPVGRSILGTTDFIKTVTREQIINYVNEHYSQRNIIIAGAGKFDRDLFNANVERRFSNFSRNEQAKPEPASYIGGDIRTFRELEQVHFILGLKGVSYLDENFYTQQVLSIIAGGGMSSRLFQEIREKRGLAYTISSFGSSYSDTGLFGIYTGLSENKVNEMIEVIAEELHKLTFSITEEELKRAKAQVRAGLLMSQESSVSRAEKLAGNYAAYGRYIEVQEIMDKINSITLDSIHNFAKRLFKSSQPLTIAAIGKINKIYDYDTVVKKLEL